MKPESYIRSGVNSVNLDGTGGGRPELTATEIGAALRGCHDACYYLAIDVLLGHEHKMKVAGYVYDSKLKQHKDKKKDKGVVLLTNMAILIVSEVTGPMSCLSCGGTGFMGIDPCSECKNGKMYPSNAQKAHFCNIKDWRQWKHVYESGYNECSGWLSEAYSRLGGE